jgi:2-C-methyl-D-erythritol 4-phosphate cytidylyltransferase
MNTAIIVAAGSGERFRSETPKQFLELKGKSVIEWTIERIAAVPSVDSIILVLSPDDVDEWQGRLRDRPKIDAVVPGGTTRAGSVRNGLNAVAEYCEIVAIHDGARPLVSVAETERVIAKAKEVGAACLVAPVTDTIKSISGSEIAATLDRDKLRRALTPQAFRKEVLERAFELANPNEPATDDSYIVERSGHPVAFVEGSSVNIKITHPEDLILAKALIESETVSEFDAFGR